MHDPSRIRARESGPAQLIAMFDMNRRIRRCEPSSRRRSGDHPSLRHASSTLRPVDNTGSPRYRYIRT
jgi:hypothetical protein